jgi:hypothetical protein
VRGEVPEGQGGGCSDFLGRVVHGPRLDQLAVVIDDLRAYGGLVEDFGDFYGFGS